MATRRIHNAVMDEFGDRSITETLDNGISSLDEIELQERIDLVEFPWAGRSFGELENTPPAVELQNSGKHSTFIFNVLLISVDSVMPTGPAAEV